MERLKLVLIFALVLSITSCNKNEEGKSKKINDTIESSVIVDVDEEVIEEVIWELLWENINDEYVIVENDFIKTGELLSESVFGKLSQAEIAGLVQMREEEKLAHDVYVTLYEKWGQKIFNNISKSEQTHTDAVGELLEKYNIEDPINSDTKIGEFTIPLIQRLYDDLIEKGNISLVSALEVGTTIEDLDIYDLQEFLKEVKNEDIERVYDNLLRGSRNHMRAFDKTLQKQGGLYTAQYISQVQYDEIIWGEQERGDKGGENGKNK